MSSLGRPQESCLVGISLIVSSRSDSRFVLHYPPQPTADPPFKRKARTKSGRDVCTASLSDTDDECTEDDDIGDDEVRLVSGRSAYSALYNNPATRSDAWAAGVKAGGGDVSANISLRSASGPAYGSATSLSQLKRQSAPYSDMEDNKSSDEDDPTVGTGEKRRGQRGSKPLEWEEVFGLRTSVWGKILSPTRSFHKKRFEVGVNDLTFVGWPVFVREDGIWKKKQKKKGLRRPQPESDSGSAPAMKGRKSGSSTRLSELQLLEENEATNILGKDENELDHEREKDGMTMFNVVFILNPPLLEYNFRVREQYDNVIKKFGKGLKSEQERVGYVWEQSQTILHIKERAKENRLSSSELYSEILRQSSLARAIARIYHCIKNSQIASVTLSNPNVFMSLQIPPLTSTSVLPNANEPAYPGLWLTTADALANGEQDPLDEFYGYSHVLGKHHTLLLLADEATILRDIEISSGHPGPKNLGLHLANYVRASRPTKSFAQVSAMSGIPLGDILVLAAHLIYWRRARLIPPLHQRNTYIVSPNCDMSRLSQASVEFSSAFPTMPSLPKMLALLSGTPRQYSDFIQKGSKELYYFVLAWLFRGGWVTQLRTFAWIKATPTIKHTVAEKMAIEEREKANSTERISESIILHKPKAAAAISSTSGRNTRSVAFTGAGSEADADTGIENGAEFGTISYSSSPDSPSKFKRRLTRNESRASTLTSSIISRPHRASPLESRWLDEIYTRFPDPQPTLSLGSLAERTKMQDEEAGFTVQRYFPLFRKYFNGHDSLESICFREGLNRKVAWRLLFRMSAGISVPEKIKQERTEATRMRKTIYDSGARPVIVPQSRFETGSDIGETDTREVEKENILVIVRHW